MQARPAASARDLSTPEQVERGLRDAWQVLEQHEWRLADLSREAGRVEADVRESGPSADQQHHLEILQGEIDQLLRDTDAIRASLKAKRCQ